MTHEETVKFVKTHESLMALMESESNLFMTTISGRKLSLIGWQKGKDKDKEKIMRLKEAEKMSMLSTVVLTIVRD